ncbi:MAG: T9SS type A sorting domain-containing protein [Bacteroidota bacterium]
MTVPQGETWDLGAVTLAFAPGTRLVVNGTLNADGAVFTATDPAQGWEGIRFQPGSGGLLEDATIELVNFPGVNNPGPSVYVYNASPVFEGVVIQDSFGGGLLATGPQAVVHVRPSSDNFSTIRDNVHRHIVANNSAEIYLDEVILDDTESVAVYANDANIYVRLSEINDSATWGVRAYNHGQVGFGFYDPTAPSGQNNVVQVSTVGTLFGLQDAMIYAGGAGQIFGDSFRNNWFRRNSGNPNERHIKADDSDIIAECNYWDRALGPDPAYIDVSNGGAFDSDPYLSSPPGPSVSCSSLGITTEEDPPSNMRASPHMRALRTETAYAKTGATEAIRGEDVPGLAPGGPPEGMMLERWLAIAEGFENADRSVAIDHAVRAIERAATPHEASRAFAVAAQLGRRDLYPGLESFLVGESRRPANRGWALEALASIYYGTGRTDAASETARTLTTEFAGTEHERRGWLTRFSLAVDAGDLNAADEALQAFEVRWPEDEGLADLKTARALRGEREASEEPRAVPFERIDLDGATAPVQATSEAEDASVPMVTALQPVYPNPTAGGVTVPLALAEAAEVRLALVNTLGQRVRTGTARRETAGEHAYRLSTAGLAPGVYVVQVTVTTGAGARQYHRTLTVAE